MITLEAVYIFTFRGLFTTGITFGAFKVGGFLSTFLIGSVLTFNQDVLDKKEHGLLICYHCNKQVDPKTKANSFTELDEEQGLVSIPCASCRRNNYFPIPLIQKHRALHGGKIYGELKERLFGNRDTTPIRPN